MAAAPQISMPVDRELAIGEEFQVDVKEWQGEHKKPNKSFSGSNLSLTCVDAKSKFMYGNWIPNKTEETFLKIFKSLRHKVLNKGRVLKTIRVDNAFVTKAILDWGEKANITFLPCIPYEHRETSTVERDHRNLGDGVVKALDQPHLTPKYIAFAYYHCVDTQNMLPSLLSPATTPQLLWDNKKIDLRETPILPFGCVVKAHIPLNLQTVISGRCFDGIVVGRAAGHRGGLLIFNPRTRRTVIRRTYKIMGPEPVISTILQVPILFEAVDKVVDDHPSVYGGDMGFRQDNVIDVQNEELLRIHWVDIDAKTKQY